MSVSGTVIFLTQVRHMEVPLDCSLPLPAYPVHQQVLLALAVICILNLLTSLHGHCHPLVQATRISLPELVSQPPNLGLLSLQTSLQAKFV